MGSTEKLNKVDTLGSEIKDKLVGTNMLEDLVIDTRYQVQVDIKQVKILYWTTDARKREEW